MLFDNRTFLVENDESVLDCLLRHQVDVAYSCKSGSCHSCLLKAEQDDVSAIAQQGLKPTAIEQGFFLSCQQKAALLAEANYIDDKLLYIRAELVSKNNLAMDICQLFIKPEQPFTYRAGQFINLKNPNGIVRSYSIANIPADGSTLELHIHRKRNGLMSQWIQDELNVGDCIDIQGPIGECFYCTEELNSPITMIGTGTGAAPLLGILRDALYQGHQGSIHFYHGARNFDSLYLHQSLLDIEAKYSNVNYRPSLSSDTDTSLEALAIDNGHCNDIALTEMIVSASTLLFLCGNPWMVKQTKTKAFLSGIASGNIYTDPFEYKELRTKSR
ncbi:MAG: NAD(P)H-flavin reductase/ferredoxin [Saprospiraceae bacterium]